MRPGISVNLAAAFGREVTRAELAVFGHVMDHMFPAGRQAGALRPFRQCQATIARKLGYSRVTVSRAVTALARRGVLVVRRRRRACSLVVFGDWMRKALGKVHKAVRHLGLVWHVENCWKEKMRRRFGGVPFVGSTEAERERRAWKPPRYDPDPGDGSGLAGFKAAIAGLERKARFARALG